MADDDATRIARVMIKERGAKALEAALFRVGLLQGEGDSRNAELWRQVAAAIERLQASDT